MSEGKTRSIFPAPGLDAAILSNAWGCLSKQDDNTEQLRLVRKTNPSSTRPRRFPKNSRTSTSPG